MPPYVVLAIQTKDGHYYLSSVAPNAVAKLHTIVGHQKHFQEARWYVSHDSALSRYPRVRTLRGVRVSQQEYERITTQATPL